jgi:hemoglobin-like flavoprotein
LLTKGEQKIGRVLFKNIFQLKPSIMKMFNPFCNEEKELFLDPEFLRECTNTIRTIGAAVPNLNDIDAMVPDLINLGWSYHDKGVTLKDYAVVLQSIVNTLKAGLGQGFNPELR